MREYKFKVHLQGGNSLMFEHQLEEDIAAEPTALLKAYGALSHKIALAAKDAGRVIAVEMVEVQP